VLKISGQIKRAKKQHAAAAGCLDWDMFSSMNQIRFQNPKSKRNKQPTRQRRIQTQRKEGRRKKEEGRRKGGFFK